jgi:2-oxoglutarate/2-oxoacid ferredoxin oxidoreductase subunit alpha
MSQTNVNCGLKPGKYYLQGAQACIEGAIIAGSKVYGGYPITPASEIMEHAAKRFPQVGGRFIQMEDEIASACVLLGASWAGAKAITATSGPGFSLMQETISYAIMSETPLVIVNVQRPGPGQGYVSTSQEDVMQARWGHHGEGSIIALSPASVQDLFDFTIEAFNLAERWRTPVLIMTEETISHMQERLVVPSTENITIVNRTKPQDRDITPEQFLLSGHGEVPPMPFWGEGFKVNHVGLVRYEDGFIGKYNPEMHFKVVNRIRRKIEGNVDTIAQIEVQYLEGCHHLLICYGAVSRTGIEAVIEAREKHDIKIGFIRLKTLWPFPENQLRNLVSEIETIFVPEINLGMMKHPITEALRDRCRRVVSIPSLGTLHSPEMILTRMMEEFT